MAKRSGNRGRPAQPKVPVASASVDGPNRQARKEEARRQREALNRRMARRTYARWGIVALIVVVAVVVGVVIAMNQPAKKTAAPGGTTALKGMQAGAAPWGPGQDGLLQRIKAIGLPFGHTESTAFHIHDHLAIYVDGKQVTVPQYVGINYPAPQNQVFIAVIHTHDDTGIIHIESPVQRDYTLGQFFDVWGVTFTSTRIGGYTAGGSKTLQVFLDGKPVTGDPRSIVLTQHEEIVVTYGTHAQLPRPMPSDYSGSLSTSCAPGC